MGFKRYLALIGIILLAFILVNIDLGKLLDIILKANILLLAFTLVLFIANLSLKAFKWKIVIKAFDLDYPFSKCFSGWASGFFVSIFTPARVGDFIRSFYLSADKEIPTGKALSTVLIERLIDVALVLLLGFTSVLFFAVVFGKEIVSIEILAAVIIFFILFVSILLKKKYMKMLLNPFFNTVVPTSFKEQLKLNFSSFYESIIGLKSKKILLAKATLIGFITWLIAIFMGYVLFSALGLNVPFYYAFVIVPLIGLVDLLPISISGFGTREAAVIFLLSFYSISAENSVAFSLLYYFFGYIPVALTGFYFFIKRPIDFKKAFS